MKLSWKDYILSHKDREAYDEGVDLLIQSIIDIKANAETNFLHLSEHPTLVTLSRSSLKKEAQLAFFHSIRKSSLLEKNYSHFALVGMGHQACTMKVDPREIFRLAPKRRIPTFNDLMKCGSLERIQALVPKQTMAEEKLESHALIPPLILEAIVELDSLNAQDILLACIQKIQSLKKVEPRETQIPQEETTPEAPTEQIDSWEEFTEDDLANLSETAEDKRSSDLIKQQKKKVVKDTNPGLADEPKEDDTFDTEDRYFEQRFSRILIFLWSVIHEGSSIKPVHITICNKDSTLIWLDSIHEKCLGPSLPPQPQTMLPPPFPIQMNTNLGLDSVAVAMTKLSDAWGKKIEMEVQEKEEREKKKKEKSFEKLSDVQQRTLILIITTEDDTDDTLPSMKPT